MVAFFNYLKRQSSFLHFSISTREYFVLWVVMEMLECLLVGFSYPRVLTDKVLVVIYGRRYFEQVSDVEVRLPWLW